MFAVMAMCLGLAAAAAFGAASVLEERSTKQVPERAALSPRLLADLVRRPLFLASIGVNVAGAGLQILALHFGSLTLVQPLLVLSLLFAVVIASVTVRRRPPDAVLVAGVVCCAAGIAGFLAVARPHGGAGTADPAAALPLAAGLGAVLAGCLAAARWGPRTVRPLWLALGCGAAFGVNALLLKIVPGTLPAGFADPLRQWPLYLMMIVTPVGFLLNQNAFQAGSLIAPVLAVITTADPLVSIGVGAAFLHEKIAAAPPHLAAEGLCLAITIGGIIALALRAPHVAQALDPPRPAEPVPAAGSTAGAGPGVAEEQLIKVWRPALAVPAARSGLSPRGADAAQCAVLIRVHRDVAHADAAKTPPCCSIGTRRTECSRIPRPPDRAACPSLAGAAGLWHPPAPRPRRWPADPAGEADLVPRHGQRAGAAAGWGRWPPDRQAR